MRRLFIFIRCVVVLAGLGLLSNTLAAAAPAPNVGLLTVGQVIDLSGPNSALGRDYVAGIRTSFDAINAAGGINGKRVQYLVLDDVGDAINTPRLVTELIEHNKIDVLLGGIGDASVLATLNTAAFKHSGLSLNAPLAAVDDRRVVNWRPDRLQEIRYLLGYFEKLGIKRVGIAYQEASIHGDALNALTDELKQRGMTISGIARIDTNANGALMQQETQKLAVSRPGFVVTIADTISSALFLKAFRESDQKTFVAGTSLINLSTLREIAGIKAVEWTVFSQVVPNPSGAKTPLQIEHAAMMKKFRDEAVSSLTLEGFLVGKTLAKTLQPGAPRTVDLGGLMITAIPGTASQSRYLDIALFKKGAGLVF